MTAQRGPGGSSPSSPQDPWPGASQESVWGDPNDSHEPDGMGETDELKPAQEAQLVLVDADDVEVGVLGRAACHVPGGMRHRAFSVYLFDDAGQLLVQRRHATKPLWPGYWSNSVCSHPRPGEPVAAAAERRVREELGVHVALTRRFVYEYRADFGVIGTEHEVVHVFVGKVSPDEVRPNPTEVAAWRMQSVTALDAALAARDAPDPSEGDAYTPWFRLAWPRVRGHTTA